MRFGPRCLPVRSHDDLDVTPRIETVQLVDQLQHGPLNLIVSTGTIIKSSTSNSVDFIKEDDTGLFRSSHFEQFSNHSCTFSNVLLDQLGTDDYWCQMIISYADNFSLPRMKVLSVRLATARAQSVLPVPGGPYSKTPFGGSIPRFANRSG